MKLVMYISGPVPGLFVQSVFSSKAPATRWLPVHNKLANFCGKIRSPSPYISHPKPYLSQPFIHTFPIPFKTLPLPLPPLPSCPLPSQTCSPSLPPSSLLPRHLCSCTIRDNHYCTSDQCLDCTLASPTAGLHDARVRGSVRW